MKEELVRYTCDNCEQTVTVSSERSAYFGTALHHNWIRMYILLKSTDAQKTKLHFCCKDCSVMYLIKL